MTSEMDLKLHSLFENSVKDIGSASKLTSNGSNV